MKGDHLLAVADDRTLSIIDIDKTSVEKHTSGNTGTSRLFKLTVPDNQGVQSFAGVTTNGLLKIWNEVLIDGDGKLVRQDMDPYRIESLKVLKAGGL